jgi:hypothetical protein
VHGVEHARTEQRRGAAQEVERGALLRIEELGHVAHQRGEHRVVEIDVAVERRAIHRHERATVGVAGHGQIGRRIRREEGRGRGERQASRVDEVAVDVHVGEAVVVDVDEGRRHLVGVGILLDDGEAAAVAQRERADHAVAEQRLLAQQEVRGQAQRAVGRRGVGRGGRVLQLLRQRELEVLEFLVRRAALGDGVGEFLGEVGEIVVGGDRAHQAERREQRPVAGAAIEPRHRLRQLRVIGEQVEDVDEAGQRALHRAVVVEREELVRGQVALQLRQVAVREDHVERADERAALRVHRHDGGRRSRGWRIAVAAGRAVQRARHVHLVRPVGEIAIVGDPLTGNREHGGAEAPVVDGLPICVHFGGTTDGGSGKGQECGRTG